MKKMSFAFFIFTSMVFFGCSKNDGGGGSTPDKPTLSITNVSQERKTTSSTYTFTVKADKTSSSDISVSYTTADGSARQNTDYTPVSGTLTIPANKTSATIDVTVTGDSLRKDNQIFYLQLSGAVNATLPSGTKGTGTIVNVNGSYLPTDNSGYTTPDNYPGYTLAWSDEFNGSAVNTNDWTYETGASGWGNNELENYTSSAHNSFVSNGNLVIEARQETGAGGAINYTSARMITKNKKTFQFGRVDIRAKLPKGKGIWPALWMLGNNIDAVSWPACGEIDIMELLGQEPTKVYGTLHWGSTSATHQSKGTSITSASGYDEAFHVYSMLWKQDSVTLLIDDVPYLNVSKTDVAGSNYPFNSDFFFIFNVAIGGNWPGNPDQTTEFPQRMFVDYVRVFQ